jgi:hypothetical protein
MLKPINSFNRTAAPRCAVAAGHVQRWVVMATLIWQAPMRYFSSGDEAAFFSWLQAIPGVIAVKGCGRELHIQLRSKRLSAQSLRELIALYLRYSGNLSELAQFENSSNSSWFSAPQAVWHKQVFGEKHGS